MIHSIRIIISDNINNQGVCQLSSTVCVTYINNTIFDTSSWFSHVQFSSFTLMDKIGYCWRKTKKIDFTVQDSNSSLWHIKRQMVQSDRGVQKISEWVNSFVRVFPKDFFIGKISHIDKFNLNLIIIWLNF